MRILINKRSHTNTILKEATQEVQRREMEALNNEMALGESHVFSETFNRKMEKLLRFSQKSYFPYVNTIGKRVAIITIAVVISLSATAFSVKAIRVPVVNFFVNVYEKFSSIVFQSPESKKTYPTAIEQFYEPDYLPEGYTLLENQNLLVATQIIYSNSNGNELIFEQYVITSNELKVDTEGVEIEKITVDDNKALFYSNKGIHNLVWTDGVYGYKITGEIDKEVMLKIARSIILKNK